MKCPVNLQTKEGLQEWESIHTKYEFSKTKNIMPWFKHYCQNQSMQQEVELIKFLEKTESEINNSDEYMIQWKQMADKQALYSYFSRITK